MEVEPFFAEFFYFFEKKKEKDENGKNFAATKRQISSIIKKKKREKRKKLSKEFNAANKRPRIDQNACRSILPTTRRRFSRVDRTSGFFGLLEKTQGRSRVVP